MFHRHPVTIQPVSLVQIAFTTQEPKVAAPMHPAAAEGVDVVDLNVLV